MARTTAWVLAALIMCAVPAAAQDRGRQGKDQKAQPAANHPDQRQRWKWWLHDRAELGISDQQSAAINEIFESQIPKLRAARQELDRAEAELSETIKAYKADVTTVAQLLDRVETARTEHNKLRVLMLYRMQLMLSAEQRAKLEALRQRQDARRKQSENGRRH